MIVLNFKRRSTIETKRTLAERFGTSRSSRAPRRCQSRRRQFEVLEDRLLLAVDPTPLEQEMLEHVNRMRIDPQGELAVLFDSLDPLHSPDGDIQAAVNFFGVDGNLLQSQWSQLTPTSPLAWNQAVYDAARNHSQLIIAHDTQSHQLPGEASLLNRIVDAGYNWSGSIGVGENVFAFADTVFYGHAAFAVDWGGGTGGMQSPPGHRQNIMNSSFQEVGIGILTDSDPGTQVGPLVVTQDFARRGNYGDANLLGVVFSDNNSNGRFDAGEGLSNVSIDVTSSGAAYSTTTMSAGGYQVKIPPGTYTVTASGGGLPQSVSLGSAVVGSANVKLDLNTAALPTGSVQGQVFADADADGLKAAGELGLAGWSVYLDANDNGQLDSGESTTSTDGNGTFQFAGLTTGDYKLRQLLPSGWRSTTPSAGFHAISLSDGVTVSGIDFGNFQTYSVSGDTVDIYGTDAVDQFIFSAGQVHDVRVGGEAYSFDDSAVDVFNFHGFGGSDEIVLTGTSGDEQVELRPGLSQLVGGTYQVHVSDVELVDVYSGGGVNDRADLYDSAGDERLTARPEWVRLTGTDFEFYVNDFDRVYAFATAGGADDRAYLYGSTSDDRFYGRADYGLLRADGYQYYNYASGFDRVYAFATPGGGTDRAYLYDSSGDDRFYGREDYSILRGSNYEFYNYANGFGQVYAYANSGSNDDRAYLYDSAGDDTLTGRPEWSRLSGNGFSNYVSTFDRVYSYATAGGAVDRAYLYDSDSDDIFSGRPEWSQISGAGFLNYASNFDRVYAYASEGHDRAYLYDSTGNDRFYGRSNYSLLRGSQFEFYNYASGFDRVYAYADEGGADDRAYLYDSAGSDRFYGKPDYGLLRGSNFEFYNYAGGFDRVYAYASGNGDDRAYMYDSVADDTFFGRSAYGRLSGNAFFNYASGFDRVDAYSSQGGTDTVDVSAVDYAFQSVGNWL